MIARLLRALLRAARPPRDADEREDPPFVAGLVAGALVGAAIAGSTIWRRLRRR